jgi:hypothetical protein
MERVQVVLKDWDHKILKVRDLRTTTQNVTQGLLRSMRQQSSKQARQTHKLIRKAPQEILPLPEQFNGAKQN